MKILYLHPNNNNHQFYNDYMSDLLLHGLRDLIGEDIVDYPGCWYLYSDEIKKRNYNNQRFWGKGFTIKNILDNYNSIDRENINQKIKNKYFDLIIYGSIRRSNLLNIKKSLNVKPDKLFCLFLVIGTPSLKESLSDFSSFTDHSFG